MEHRKSLDLWLIDRPLDHFRKYYLLALLSLIASAWLVNQCIPLLIDVLQVINIDYSVLFVSAGLGCAVIFISFIAAQIFALTQNYEVK
tara:strand:- start:4408 stop:4674 length:267 start_codon:yes stop_codon:yes gene_type:complete